MVRSRRAFVVGVMKEPLTSVPRGILPPTLYDLKNIGQLKTSSTHSTNVKLKHSFLSFCRLSVSTTDRFENRSYLECLLEHFILCSHYQWILPA